MTAPAVLAIAHRIFINGQVKPGGMDIILDDLRARGATVLMADLQLSGQLGFARATGLEQRGVCVLRRLRPDGEEPVATYEFPRVPEPVRWGLEAAWLPGILRRHLGTDIPRLALAADPLCCLAADHLRRRGMIDRFHFHAVDYSERRFGRAGLDALYQALYRRAVRQAASVTVVSQPMFQKVEAMLGAAGKVLWLPNTPVVAEYPFVPIEQRRPHRLVCATSGIQPVYRVLELIEILAGLRRRFADAELLLLGHAELNPAYAAEVRERIRVAGLESAVEWAGFLARDEARRLVAGASVGVALYDASVEHIRYGDSLKLREYAASGLPSVGDPVCATAAEAQEHGAGVVVNDAAEAVARIGELWSGPARYASMSAAARHWAELRDKGQLMEGVIQQLGLGGLVTPAGLGR